MEVSMPDKFPEKLPPKGEGRVDDKHRVALLTEPEIGALNFLKNMDRSMGFKSGFSPMMKGLAAQNTEPLQYVEYRGEKIPSLNDYTTEQPDDTYDSGYTGNHDISDYSFNPFDSNTEINLGGFYDSIGDYFKYGGNQTGTGYYDGSGNVHDIDVENPANYPFSNDDSPYNPNRPESESDSEPPPPITYYQDWEGKDYSSQENADARNKELMNTVRDSAYGASQTYLDTEYGDAFTKEVSGDTDAYVKTFGDELALAYDQAQDGLYDDQAQSGIWDQTGYDNSMSSLDTALATENTALTDYVSEFTGKYTDAKNTWKTEQDSAADALYGNMDLDSYNQLKGYGGGYYNEDGSIKDGLDLSSYKDNQVFGGTFAADDYDFLGEFSKITPDGQRVEATVVPPTAATEIPEGDTSRSLLAGPDKASRTKKKKYKTTANTPLTGSGSSSSIN